MNTLIAQCGGPTPVINASLAAIIELWQERDGRGQIAGSRYGLQGLATGDWVNLSTLTPSMLTHLDHQPGAALGSSRYRPADDDLPRMVEHLATAAIDAVYLIGGNGTMAAAQRLTATAAALGVTLQVIGVPKTIDNDLAGTDVTPGYASAARYIAYTTQEISLDLRAMRGFDQVAVVEVMGRHAGWLAAASTVARTHASDPPHLILLPEAPVAVDQVLARIHEVFQREQLCVIVVAEGVHDHGGQFWAELLGSAGLDASGQPIFSMSAGASAYLVQQVQQQLGLRCRQIRLNTAQRSTRLLASPIDRALARLAGSAAVDAGRDGCSNVMVALHHRNAEWLTTLTPLGEVVGHAHALPGDYINPAMYDVTSACRSFIEAIIGEPPPAPLLWTEE